MTLIRDAAVAPRAGDYLVPTNAGQADPHGALCVSPEIHGSEGVHPLTAPLITEAANIAKVKATHPVTLVKAVVSNALPTAQAAGGTLTITGQYFVGATGVTIGGVAATGVVVPSNNGQTLTCVVPAGAAGAANVVVTTPGGASNSFAYTRGA